MSFFLLLFLPSHYISSRRLSEPARPRAIYIRAGNEQAVSLHHRAFGRPGTSHPTQQPRGIIFRCSSLKRRACGDHVSRHKILYRTLGVVEGSNTNARSGRIPLVFYASVAPEHLLGPRHQEISHHFLCNAAAAAPSSTLPFPGEEGQFRALTA